MFVCVGPRLTSTNQGLVVVGVIALISVVIILAVTITWMLIHKGMICIASYVTKTLLLCFLLYRTMAISGSRCDRIQFSIGISCVVDSNGIICCTAKK